jgi:hypothetical protein
MCKSDKRSELAYDTSKVSEKFDKQNKESHVQSTNLQTAARTGQDGDNLDPSDSARPARHQGFPRRPSNRSPWQMQHRGW